MLWGQRRQCYFLMLDHKETGQNRDVLDSSFWNPVIAKFGYVYILKSIWGPGQESDLGELLLVFCAQI